MLPVLDNDHLRTLIAIAETGSFTRAADIVHKTQSAVSMQIRRLEERIGRDLFEKEGRAARLTEDGERLLDYAYRMIRLNDEAVASFRGERLTGRVKLGVPDDYAERYLPQILARFTASNPGIEVLVVCEPTPCLIANLQSMELDMAIITHSDKRAVGEIIREERLLWVTSQRHCTHEARPVPLALGRDTCNWREAAVTRLKRRNVPHRILYTSWNSAAVGAVVLAGLSVSVLPESAVRAGMRVLTEADGFPDLPSVQIALVRNAASRDHVSNALADHIMQSLDNLSIEGKNAMLAAE
ncbi:LysR substrate-binding domain-containing protein [Rhabdaerophilum sp. SD176]|uniref:LysR substrate-binding domain-containing protein n=1 Tax=Rhabdaerophilum sp. SD176 TaxID=2983548 RepID=UPI0022BE7FCD|nr:LysR substrate-binding domain-containing protein [Rhabdaerophilum sp. SD176]MCZ8182345.1 LysR substrate-binding domain-containing protein [Beijerinckiaceae bacterium]MCZ8298916.1 LysR substrate-binding domain-containing protein [Beijerinckiaceae bacterium]